MNLSNTVFAHPHNFYVGTTLSFDTQFFICLSCKFCVYYMLIHCLISCAPHNYRLSVGAQTVSIFNLLSEDIDPISDLYLDAIFTVAALDRFSQKHAQQDSFEQFRGIIIWSSVLLDVLQKGFFTNLISPYHTDHIINFSPTCFFSSIKLFTANISILSSTPHRVLSLPCLSLGSVAFDETCRVSFFPLIL